MESSAGTVINTSTFFEELEIEFARMTDSIKQALLKLDLNVVSLIEQLRPMTGVKEKKVPIFQDDIFEKVTSIELLWQKLSNFWSLLDYDLLMYLVRLINREEITKILDDFISKIDLSKLQDKDIVLQCTLIEQECMKPKLRVKVNTEECDEHATKRIKETLCKQFDLEMYSLYLRGIKQGCFELVYHVPKHVMMYLLEFKVTGHIMTELAAQNIICLQCDDDKELQIPATITYLVCTIFICKYIAMYMINESLPCNS